MGQLVVEKKKQQTHRNKIHLVIILHSVAKNITPLRHAHNLPLHIVPLSAPSRSPLMLIRPLEDMMKVCQDEIFSRDVKMNVAL